MASLIVRFILSTWPFAQGCRGVIGVLSDGLVMLGVNTFRQMVIKGCVIITAVVLDQIQRKMQRQMALQSQLG